MCRLLIYDLICCHSSQKWDYCPESQTSGRIPCKSQTFKVVSYPTPAQFEPAPTCHRSECHFHRLDGVWNCCWCGKTCNTTGRCSGGMMYYEYTTCDHICCPFCKRGGQGPPPLF
ncbi:hypothetical protein V8C37DRAFT_319734 [Trichoderma ceciliae]